MRLDEITRRGFLKGAGALAASGMASQTTAKGKWVVFARKSGGTVSYDSTTLEHNSETGQYQFTVKSEGTSRFTMDEGDELLEIKLNVKSKLFAVRKPGSEYWSSTARITPGIVPDAFIRFIQHK